MRTLPLLAFLAACGQSGLLLDVSPGSKDVKSVEVFVAAQKQGDYMGMPPANSQAATQGPVYEIADTVATPLDSDGHARILLQPGAIDQVPALLVLGYNANHEAITYAIVQDPNGPIMLRHTQSDTIDVTLEPATSSSVGMARMPAGTTPRVVRWSAAKGGDDLQGPCVGVIEDATQGIRGTFFGPHDDLDCDNATPECDDNWFLKIQGAGHCVSNMIANDPFMGACQLGTTAGCIDNNPASGVCTQLQQVVCGPTAFCDDCSNRTLEMSGCLANTSMSDTTPRIECQLLVADNGAGGATACDAKASSIDMALLGLFGPTWSCDSISGFTNYLDATMTSLPSTLALKGANSFPLAMSCHLDSTVLGFGVSAPFGAPITDPQQETWAGIVIGVHPTASSTGPNHFLVLPIHVTYVVGQCPADGTVETLTCGYSPGTGGGTPINADLMWNCAGTTRG